MQAAEGEEQLGVGAKKQQSFHNLQIVKVKCQMTVEKNKDQKAARSIKREITGKTNESEGQKDGTLSHCK